MDSLIERLQKRIAALDDEVIRNMARYRQEQADDRELFEDCLLALTWKQNDKP